MTDQNTEQAKALAAALLPHLIESLKTDVLPAMLEEQIGGLKTKTTELLDEVKKGRADKDAMTALLEKHNIQMETTKALLNPQKKDPPKNTDPVTLTRSDARVRSKYLAAEAEAAKRGVPLRITDDPRPDAPEAKGTHVKTDTHLFVTKAALRDRQTFLRMDAMAKKEGLRFQTVTSLDEVPDADA